MAKKQAEDTPMLKQYFAVKAQHPEAVLLYRVGDFYETYSDDAILVSKVLGLVQTKRSNGDKEAVPMAGFPHHAIEQYLTRLIRAGYKVAVCDQLEDPKLVGNRTLVKRGVTEMVTPGIAFGENMLEQKEHNFLTGLTFSKDQCGAAFLDVSTGTFQVAQGSTGYIGTLIASLSPKEIVVRRGFEKTVKELYGENLYVSTMDEWAFVHDAAVEKLKKQLHVESLKGYAIDTYPLGVCSAGALVVYLEQTQHAGLANICSISRIDEDKFVWMDRFTLRNLEVFNASAGGEGVSLVNVVDKCCSPMGSRLLRSWLAMPSMDLKELGDRFDIVECFTKNEELLTGIQERISNIGDLDRIMSRVATGKIMPREVLQLGRGLSQLGPIKSLCSGEKGCAPLEELVISIDGCSDLYDRIARTLTPDAAAAIGKGDVIAKGVDPELDRLRDISHGGKEYLLMMQQRETERTGISSLKIGYNNVFGYYIEVRNAHKDKVPEDWIRKQTLVNAERYITQELKDYEEQILSAEDKIYALESSIYGALIAEIQKSIRTIQRNSMVIAKLDILVGFAELALENHYCRPEVGDGLELEIKAGRHPVIETLMKPGEEYVPNDIYLDRNKQQIIILTGPNMSGKSALLRQTALIVLLAQIGSFVPATSAKIGYFDKIFTRVGASDNISRGESTFMVEMLETSMILHNLSERSLVLLDEIGRGTSTYDGMSIARAIVEYIHEYGKGAKTLFATHYHELNDLEGIYPRVKNFHVTVKEVGKEVVFLRKIKEGGTAHSFGIHVARMAGMPREVLVSAEKTLSALEAGNAGFISKGEGNREAGINKPYNTKEGRVESDGSIQLSLFQLDDPTLSSMRDTLKAADLNNMTPMQAFDLLRDMKKELGI
ncbi:MAG: DNA mismatch repair protein MutS [Candidatus Cryptobacteroides sp.]|nr:DNA mismatch repair protein MutS [Bacteroides sp.]MDY5301496.1 DNA mismatch repair protein MutS [Candidatus Cryptobacteroides sp.]